MVLNWNLDVILGGFNGLIILIGAIIAYHTSRRKRIKPLFYFSFSYVFLALYFILDFFGQLYLNIELYQLHYVMFFLAAIFFVISIDYTIAESVNVVKMCIAVSIGSVVSVLSYLPNNIIIITKEGGTYISAGDNLAIFNSLMLLFFIVLIFIWGLKLSLNAPKQMKKESNLVLLGIFLMGPVDFIFYTLAGGNIFSVLNFLALSSGAMIIVKREKFL